MKTIIVLLIIIIIILLYNSSAENFTIVGDTTGVYELKPLFTPGKQDNPAVSLQITAQSAINPNYLDFIIKYANGRTNQVRTNSNVDKTYSYYNDISNVQYLNNPANIQYELDTNTGLFNAYTIIYNGKPNLMLMKYQIVKRIR